jgi:hypothetical protein
MPDGWREKTFPLSPVEGKKKIPLSPVEGKKKIPLPPGREGRKPSPYCQ